MRVIFSCRNIASENDHSETVFTVPAVHFASEVVMLYSGFGENKIKYNTWNKIYTFATAFFFFLSSIIAVDAVPNRRKKN